MFAAFSESATAALSPSLMPANRSRCGAPDIVDHSIAATPSSAEQADHRQAALDRRLRGEILDPLEHGGGADARRW
jgi:hypothetical protein